MACEEQFYEVKVGSPWCQKGVVYSYDRNRNQARPWPQQTLTSAAALFVYDNPEKFPDIFKKLLTNEELLTNFLFPIKSAAGFLEHFWASPYSNSHTIHANELRKFCQTLLTIVPNLAELIRKYEQTKEEKNWGELV